MNWKKANIHIKEDLQALKAKVPTGEFSAFVALLMRASKLNDNEQDRELANRELDIFIEKAVR